MHLKKLMQILNIQGLDQNIASTIHYIIISSSSGQRGPGKVSDGKCFLESDPIVSGGVRWSLDNVRWSWEGVSWS